MLFLCAWVAFLCAFNEIELFIYKKTLCTLLHPIHVTCTVHHF